jgi:hypothetical protein
MSSFTIAQENTNDFSKRVKISLREVGNQLLLTNNDTVSLILPVIKKDDVTYQLSFKNQLSFQPNTLVSIVKNVFEKTSLPKDYIVEVLQCSNNEVAYSYEINKEIEKTIIPCAGRSLPENCYTIVVTFFNTSSNNTSGYLLFFFGFILLFFVLLLIKVYPKRKIITPQKSELVNGKIIGSFEFYPEQNKLVKRPLEINLSKKECELLEIFISLPNQIIKREELTKKVWEDHGVFVGRSLDTYISKLRKKLQDDDTIQLINIHGVGYKLEIN